MPKTIITIKRGKVKAEGMDFKGDACVKELDAILEFLKEKGVSIESKKQEKKPEYFETEEEREEEHGKKDTFDILETDIMRAAEVGPKWKIRVIKPFQNGPSPFNVLVGKIVDGAPIYLLAQITNISIGKIKVMLAVLERLGYIRLQRESFYEF